MADAKIVEKMTQVWNLTWDADWVSTCAFIGPTRWVAAGNNLGQIVLWELPEKAGGEAPLPKWKLEGHTNSITRLVATNDGKRLISASLDKTIRIWDIPGTAVGAPGPLIVNEKALEEAKRRPGSKKVTPISAQVQTAKATKVLEQHREWINGLSITPDGKTLLSGDDGGNVLMWNLADYSVKQQWQVPAWVSTVAISPDAKLAIVGERKPLVFDSGRMQGIKLWETTGKLVADLSKEFQGMYFGAAAFSSDGKHLAIARSGEIDGTNGKVWLLEPATGKKVKELAPGHLNGATDVAFHPSNEFIASTGRDTQIRIWEIATGKMIKELGKGRGGQFKDWLHALSFSADGQWVVAADMAGAVQVYGPTA